MMNEVEPCCDKDYGGSHWHCGGCGEVTSMMGHYIEATYKDGTKFKGHTCVEGVKIVIDRKLNKMFVEPI